MPEPIIAFIDPKAALAPLMAKIADDLGPSAPHVAEVERQPVKPVEARLVRARLGATPDSAPHYTQILDQIWPEFDDPEERTAARLKALLEEVADEAQRVHLLAQETWPKLWLIPDSERNRYDREFLAYLRRLNGYRDVLQELDPSSTATDSVNVGLVQRKQGAGPVPDCIMHMYFAEQLGILADHAEDMGQGFIGRTMGALKRIDDAVEKAEEFISGLDDRAADATENLADRFARGLRWAGGIFLASVVVIGGTIATVAVVRARSKRDVPKELQR